MHYILMGHIEYGEGTALISCGENKARAEELAAELNALVRMRKQQSPMLCSFDVFEEWKRKHGFEHLKENMLTDKYNVHEVITI